jgi:hypothetical protein
METASLSNEAKSDQEGEARSRSRSSDTFDLEDLAILRTAVSSLPHTQPLSIANRLGSMCNLTQPNGRR